MKETDWGLEEPFSDGRRRPLRVLIYTLAYHAPLLAQLASPAHVLRAGHLFTSALCALWARAGLRRSMPWGHSLTTLYGTLYATFDGTCAFSSTGVNNHQLNCSQQSRQHGVAGNCTLMCLIYIYEQIYIYTHVRQLGRQTELDSLRLCLFPFLLFLWHHFW